MSTVVILAVLYNRGFHILQGVTGHASELNLIRHTMKCFLRQLGLQKRCEFHDVSVFESFLSSTFNKLSITLFVNDTI